MDCARLSRRPDASGGNKGLPGYLVTGLLHVKHAIMDREARGAFTGRLELSPVILADEPNSGCTDVVTNAAPIPVFLTDSRCFDVAMTRPRRVITKPRCPKSRRLEALGERFQDLKTSWIPASAAFVCF